MPQKIFYDKHRLILEHFPQQYNRNQNNYTSPIIYMDITHHLYGLQTSTLVNFLKHLAGLTFQALVYMIIRDGFG